jgi:hypothetical protein
MDKSPSVAGVRALEQPQSRCRRGHAVEGDEDEAARALQQGRTSLSMRYRRYEQRPRGNQRRVQAHDNWFPRAEFQTADSASRLATFATRLACAFGFTITASASTNERQMAHARSVSPAQVLWCNLLYHVMEATSARRTPRGRVCLLARKHLRVFRTTVQSGAVCYSAAGSGGFCFSST